MRPQDRHEVPVTEAAVEPAMAWIAANLCHHPHGQATAPAPLEAALGGCRDKIVPERPKMLI